MLCIRLSLEFYCYITLLMVKTVYGSFGTKCRAFKMQSRTQYVHPYIPCSCSNLGAVYCGLILDQHRIYSKSDGQTCQSLYQFHNRMQEQPSNKAVCNCEWRLFEPRDMLFFFGRNRVAYPLAYPQGSVTKTNKPFYSKVKSNTFEHLFKSNFVSKKIIRKYLYIPVT